MSQKAPELPPSHPGADAFRDIIAHNFGVDAVPNMDMQPAREQALAAPAPVSALGEVSVGVEHPFGAEFGVPIPEQTSDVLLSGTVGTGAKGGGNYDDTSG